VGHRLARAPNIVPVHYLELDDAGMPTIVLKRVAGVDWSALCHDGEAVARRFGTPDLLAWNLESCSRSSTRIPVRARARVVHRDLKPSNVMIGDFGEVYLLDWGIAVALHDDGSGRLPLGVNATELAGTPCYMAPEMIGGGEGAAISVRTDVYLAGSVLYELITGTPPHVGDTALAVLSSVALSEPALPASVPAELAAICLRAMARRPDDRFPTIDAMRLAIQAYLAHRGSTNLGARAAERLVGSAASSRPARRRMRKPTSPAARRSTGCSARAGSGFTRRSRCGTTTPRRPPGYATPRSRSRVRVRDRKPARRARADRRARGVARGHRARDAARTAAAEARQHAAALENLARAARTANVGRRTRTFLTGSSG